eukprot:2936524-Amphidinium_carterae.1
MATTCHSIADPFNLNSIVSSSFWSGPLIMCAACLTVWRWEELQIHRWLECLGGSSRGLHARGSVIAQMPTDLADHYRRLETVWSQEISQTETHWGNGALFDESRESMTRTEGKASIIIQTSCAEVECEFHVTGALHVPTLQEERRRSERNRHLAQDAVTQSKLSCPPTLAVALTR